MQVVSGNMWLHLDCDITATRNPHPLYVNVGLDAAPQVLGDKKRKPTLKCGSGEGCRARKTSDSPSRFAADKFRITCIMLSTHCVGSSTEG